MKKFILLAVMLLSFVFAKAQSVFITEQNYQNLKANGQLLPNVDYKFINSPSNTAYQQSHSQVINQSVTGSTAKTNSATACQCMVPIDPTFTLVPMSGYTTPFRNDDGSSASIPLGFNFCFYGTTYSSLFINNNGNVSFGTSYSSFSSNPFPDPSFVMIAPFWGDVDTRGVASGLVYFKKTATALIVKWNNVGYYSSMTDKLNDF